MRKAVSYSSGHISTIFRVCMHDEPILSGSRGAGIVIDEGVRTEVEVVPGSGIYVFFNGERMELRPTVEMVGKLAGDAGSQRIVVRHETKLPLGAGFGVSAACVIGAGMCMNDILGFGMSMDEIGEAAHVVEVECGTGLGDVGPILAGGIEVRKKEGAPGCCQIENVVCGPSELVCFSFGGLDTGGVIRGDTTKIDALADDVLNRLDSDMSFDNFMMVSLEFAKRAGFLTDRLSKLVDLLNCIDGCYASQSMLGESGFVFFSPGSYEKVRSVIRGFPDLCFVKRTRVSSRKPEVVL